MADTAFASSPQVDARFAQPEVIFYGIGAQKSGTSWLAKYLSDHSEVSFPLLKEQNYWSVVDDGSKTAGRHIERHRARLRKLGPILARINEIGWTKRAGRFRSGRLAAIASQNPGLPHSAYADSLFSDLAADQCRSAGEISPSYANLSPETYAKMLETAEEVRFLFLMRDPVDRFFSGLRHNIRKSGRGEIVSQDEFNAMVESALTDPLKSGALQNSRYDLTMQNLESVVPSAKIGYYFFETMFDQAVIDGICDFLKISRRPAEIGQVVHRGGAKHVAALDESRVRVANALAPCYSAMRKRYGNSLPETWSKSEALINNYVVA